MAQDPSGLTEGAGNLAHTVEGWLDKMPTFGKKKGSSTNAGKLPPQWEEANRKSEEQALASERKPISKRKLGGKKTRAKSGSKSKAAKRKSE